MNRLKSSIQVLMVSAYAAFILLSFIVRFNPGEQIGRNFLSFFVDMLNVLPCAFILIGLFEVWGKKETVEKHLGEESGLMGYVWCILLASTTVGGLVVAFPVAYSLYHKGANIRIIFTYLGAAAVCRIPMTIFEASFIGIKFTLIRWLISLPLIILSAIWLGAYFKRNNCKIMKGKEKEY